MARQSTSTKPPRRREKRIGNGRRKSCPYCKDKVENVDWRDVASLRRFVSDRGKLRGRRITGACRRHQSQIATAVKRARELALLPYVAEHHDVEGRLVRSDRDDRDDREGGRGRGRDRGDDRR